MILYSISAMAASSWIECQSLEEDIFFYYKRIAIVGGRVSSAMADNGFSDGRMAGAQKKHFRDSFTGLPKLPTPTKTETQRKQTTKQQLSLLLRRGETEILTTTIHKRFAMVAIGFGGQSKEGENGKRKEGTIGDADAKIIIIGDSAVGKSKLVERYVDGDYGPRRLSTHALSIYRKDVSIGKDDNNSATVDFWDTAGREKFNSMHAAYYHEAHACIMVFDVTRKETYVNLEHWYRDLRKHRPAIPCIVVANKVDVDYMVTKKNFAFAREHNLPFFFASSADGMNVAKVFDEAARAGLEHRKYGERDFLTECLELYNNPLST